MESDPKLAALLTVARQIASNTGDVDETTWRRAPDAARSDTDLAELFAHVAVNLYTNLLNHYAGTERPGRSPPGR